jgi:hypothetical protein
MRIQCAVNFWTIFEGTKFAVFLDKWGKTLRSKNSAITVQTDAIMLYVGLSDFTCNRQNNMKIVIQCLCEGECEVIPVLRHHAMKTYGGSRDITPHIHNLASR